MKTPKVIFLVEQHVGTSSPNAYWAHVYLHREHAEADIEMTADNGGHGPIEWERYPSVSRAYRAGVPRTVGSELFTVLPLTVYQRRMQDEVRAHLQKGNR